MRVLQLGADRSKRGILYPGSPASERQRAYAQEFGRLDIIGFSRTSDGAHESRSEHLTVIPTNSSSGLFYGFDALRIAKKLPKPDVVSVQDPFETGLAGWLIAKRFNVPLHVQVHTDFLSREYARHSFVNRIRVPLARFVLKRAPRIRVVSERIKRELEERYHPRAPITVLPIFVDVEKFTHAQPSSEGPARFSNFATKLLVVSRLEPEKNVELAIRSFAEASPKNACLIIVGEGSVRAHLHTLARTLSVSDRIFFEGERPAIEYYPMADLVLVTSKYEGYGMVIVEALAAGKPVLATDVGIAREAGAIVSNEKDFSNDLKQWFENGPRTAQLKNYPYKDFDDYVRAYCDDIRACTTAELSL